MSTSFASRVLRDMLHELYVLAWWSVLGLIVYTAAHAYAFAEDEPC